jgi:hypothetical protein
VSEKPGDSRRDDAFGAPRGSDSKSLRSARSSLCPDCRHVQVITSARGSVFYLCKRSKDDPRFPKYPPQPVVVCAGHER